jgi:hypothetical protein
MSNTPQRTNNNRRNNQRKKRSSGGDIWRPGGELPPVAPIEVAEDASALLRSLGEPPLPGGIDVSPYFQSAIERSAPIAAALALSVDLLAN